MLLVFLSGCTSSNNSEIKQFAKSMPEVQEFLTANPGSNIEAALFNREAMQLEDMKEKCGKEPVEEKYWLVTIKSKEYEMKIFLDESGKQLQCITKTILSSARDACSTGSECNDNDSCTKDACEGSPKKCKNVQISACTSNDSCCPAGCYYTDDNDCPNSDSCSTDIDCEDYDDSTIDSCAGTPKKCEHRLKTCAEKNGHICSLGETCPVDYAISSDLTECCPVACNETDALLE